MRALSRPFSPRAIIGVGVWPRHSAASSVLPHAAYPYNDNNNTLDATDTALAAAALARLQMRLPKRSVVPLPPDISVDQSASSRGIALPESRFLHEAGVHFVLWARDGKLVLGDIPPPRKCVLAVRESVSAGFGGSMGVEQKDAGGFGDAIEDSVSGTTDDSENESSTDIGEDDDAGQESEPEEEAEEEEEAEKEDKSGLRRADDICFVEADAMYFAQRRPAGMRAGVAEMVEVDFLSAKSRFRVLRGRLRRAPFGRAILGHTAAGTAGTGPAPSMLDATSGLGSDAYAAASVLGFDVRAIESHPVVFELLADGLRRGLRDGDEFERAALSRISLEYGDSREVLRELVEKSHAGIREGPDVVYLDPMYPSRKRGTGPAAKKEMRIVRRMIDSDHDAAELLALARPVAGKRVVVKRPSYVPRSVDADAVYKSRGVRYEAYFPATFRE